MFVLSVASGVALLAFVLIISLLFASAENSLFRLNGARTPARPLFSRLTAGDGSCPPPASLYASCLCLLLIFLFWPWQYASSESPNGLAYSLATPLYGLTFGLSILAIGVGAVLYQKNEQQNQEGGTKARQCPKERFFRSSLWSCRLRRRRG